MKCITEGVGIKRFRYANNDLYTLCMEMQIRDHGQP